MLRWSLTSTAAFYQPAHQHRVLLRFKGNGASRVFDSSADKSGKIVNAASRALVIDGPGVQVVLDDVTIEAGLYVAQVSNAAQGDACGAVRTYTGGDSAFAMYGTQNEAHKDKPDHDIIVEDDAVLTGGAELMPFLRTGMPSLFVRLTFTSTAASLFPRAQTAAPRVHAHAW